MTEAAVQEAFFACSGDGLVPEPHARSWWAPDMMHGRLLGGLMTRALEREHLDGGLHCSRLTVDLFRAVPLEPVRVQTERVRDGRRIRVVDAAVYGAGGVIARASAVLLSRAEQPAGHVPSTQVWDAPPPEELPAQSNPYFGMWMFDESNQPLHTWYEAGDLNRRIWLREARPLVAGEVLSPFVRAALAGDMSSPLVHAGDAGLEFINVDYTLCLSRLPRSESIGMESGGHVSEDGVAVGHCTLHDTAGPIGYCATTAVAYRG